MTGSSTRQGPHQWAHTLTSIGVPAVARPRATGDPSARKGTVTPASFDPAGVGLVATGQGCNAALARPITMSSSVTAASSPGSAELPVVGIPLGDGPGSAESRGQIATINAR